MPNNPANALRELLQLWDWNDALFKAVVSNPDGVPSLTPVNPTDFNRGEIANLLEYNAALAASYLEQLNPSTAIDKYLEFALQDVCGIIRYPGELQADYIERVKNVMFGFKCSCAAIVYYVSQYSSPQPPECIEGPNLIMYSDVSFSDVYIDFQIVTAGLEFGYWVWPAIPGDGPGTGFFFLLILYNTPSNELAEVVDIVNRVKAGGINYEIQVRT